MNMLRADTPTLSLTPQTVYPPRSNHALLKNEIESEGGEDVVGKRERWRVKSSRGGGGDEEESEKEREGECACTLNIFLRTGRRSRTELWRES